MKKLTLTGAISLFLTFGAIAPACAGTFDFSYSGTYSTTIKGNFTTTSESVTVGTGGHQHQKTEDFVTAIAGTFDGSQITDLLAPGTFPGGGSTNDNRYFTANTPFDYRGISFTDAAGESINLYFDRHTPTVLFGPVGCGEYLNSTGALTIDPTQPTMPVPEPGSLLVLGTALAGLGLLRRRRAA